ncbi:hypothetical protein [Microbacterium sp. BH-3-3-3]|uniref:hypothetical protein n=1 Tax=Microbacterium sp. BH-3-3-3 TaxID=1906742 RepID=UPI0011A639F6|nr:hypothetical protein [Microbacterium sp. BH-3-3-3]
MLTTVALVLLLAASIADPGQPLIWGTFTETGCEPRPRGGCRPVGTWTSDDGSLVQYDVYLDGWMDENGTTRASYQPTAILGGESIVHTPALTGAGPWIIGALLPWWVGRMFWADARSALVRRRRGRGTRISPRWDYRRSLDESRRPDGER